MKINSIIKKLLSLLVILAISLIAFLFYQNKQKEKEVLKVIKEISADTKIKFNVKTTLFTTNKDVKSHITSLKDILFYNEKIIISKGGIIKNDFINRYFNATEFKDISVDDKKLMIGYKDGFLLLKNEYINHFIFNEPIKKCISKENKIFCIKNTMIIKKKKNDFIEYYKSKDKIKDILLYNHDLYILTNKKLIIKNKYKEIKKPILNANKLVNINNMLFIISDREVFKIENNNIISFKKISSISNLIFKNDMIYFISMNGVIYNSKLKKEYLINTLVNNIFYKNDTVYILTQNGIYKWTQKIEKINLNILDNSINENYITRITKYNSDNLLISYFNSGIDIFNTKTNQIKYFIKDLTGVNDILIKGQNLYIATTSGLYFYDNKLKYYGKKNGIIGTSVSKIEWYNNHVFLGTEGGVSKKAGGIFTSIYGLHGLINNRVNSLKKVGHKLYVGTLGGVSILNDLNVVSSLKNKNFRTRWITGFEAVNNTVYIATYGGGIYIEEDDTIKEITNSKKRLFINLNTLLNYKNEYILAGTLKNGVFVYNIKNNKSFFIKNLPSLNITAINIVNNEVFIGSDFGFWHIPIKNILR